MPKTERSELEASVLRWHKMLAETTGTLSMSISRRRMTREMLPTAAAVLETVAAEMRATDLGAAVAAPPKKAKVRPRDII
jgi:hypothetical protein